MPKLIPESVVRPVCCNKKMELYGTKTVSGKPRHRCASCRRSTTARSPEEFDAREGLGYDEQAAAANAERIRERVKAGHKRFVVTALQNNTRLHSSWPALIEYCRLQDAELIVIPIHYKNISLFTAAQEYTKRWPSDASQYIVDEHIRLGGGVDVAAELKISATAARPLSAIGPLGGHNWQIIGHSKVLMDPVATPQDMKPKRCYTTGVMSVRNYSRTKQGALASFHHSVGALVVEVSGNNAFIRQLGMSGRSFYDVAGGELWKYYADGAEQCFSLPALTTGDEHVKFHDPGVRRATYGPSGMASVLKPERIFRHDVLDGYAGSHHHEKDPLTQFKKFHSGDDDYRAELDAVAKFLNETTPPNSTNYMVDSNHHDHLSQWLNRVNVNKDHRNALLILQLQEAVRRAALSGSRAGPLELYLEGKLLHKTVWLNRNKPLIIKGVDYSQHGDVGVNGGRGSASALSKATYKTVIGHSHTARIVDGCYQVGYSARGLEYARGMGTWTHTHCLQYPDGKRTLVDIFGSKWHG